MKDNFIKEFGELVAKYNISNVESMKYENNSLDEYVIVTYKNGYQKKICVTLDSLKAMIIDIIKQGGLD